MRLKNIFVALCALCCVLVAGTCFAAVSKVEDLKNAKVGVQSGSISEALVRELLGVEADAKSEKIVGFQTIAEIINALKEKKIDAAVMDEAPARYFATEDETVKILPEPVDSTSYAIAFKKGSPLIEDVDKAIEEIISDGTLAMIIARYIDDFPDPSEIDFNKGAEGGKLWVGCSASFPPYDMRSPAGFYGIDIELCAAIAKKLNKELVVADYRFEVLPEALQEGKIDMICSGLMVTEEREQTMDFSIAYDADQEVVVVLSEGQNND